MDFANSTQLDDQRLAELFLRHTAPYRHERLTVRVRYSRSADFSGSCYYRTARLFINLGRALRFPYVMATHVARARSCGTMWRRQSYSIVLSDAYQLALFIYLHELYHFLVKAAGRNVRRKEAMCDRFAARVLIDKHNCPLVDAAGETPPRVEWDFQDLHKFVAKAPKDPLTLVRPRRAARVVPVRIYGYAGELATRDG